MLQCDQAVIRLLGQLEHRILDPSGPKSIMSAAIPRVKPLPGRHTFVILKEIGMLSDVVHPTNTNWPAPGVYVTLGGLRPTGWSGRDPTRAVSATSNIERK